MGSEKRKYPRRDLAARIEVRCGNQVEWIEGIMHNISVAGACIELQSSPRMSLEDKSQVYIQSLFIDSLEVIETSIEWWSIEEGKVLLGIKFNQNAISDELFLLIKRMADGRS